MPEIVDFGEDLVFCMHTPGESEEAESLLEFYHADKDMMPTPMPPLARFAFGFPILVGLLSLLGCNTSDGSFAPVWNAVGAVNNPAGAAVVVHTALVEVEAESTPSLPENPRPQGGIGSGSQSPDASAPPVADPEEVVIPDATSLIPADEFLSQAAVAIQQHLEEHTSSLSENDGVVFADGTPVPSWIDLSRRRQIILFSAPWCQHCPAAKALIPNMTPPVSNWRVDVMEIDAKDSQSTESLLAEEAFLYYGEPQSLPCWIIIEDGIEEVRYVGTNREALYRAIREATRAYEGVPIVVPEAQPPTRLRISGLALGTLKGGRFLLEHRGESLPLNDSNTLVIPEDVNWTASSDSDSTTLTFSSRPVVETQMTFLTLRTELQSVTFSTTRITLGLKGVPDLPLDIDWNP